MGAQAHGRAREALRPYGLFVSPTCGGLSNFAHTPPEAQKYFSRGLPAALTSLDCAQSSALAGYAAMPNSLFCRDTPVTSLVCGVARGTSLPARNKLHGWAGVAWEGTGLIEISQSALLEFFYRIEPQPQDSGGGPESASNLDADPE